MNNEYKVSRMCIACDYSEDRLERGKTLEIEVCPECNGAFVDKFFYGKHIVKKNIFASSKTKKDKPLLTIELQNESSVPKVIYKGVEITRKVNVFFDWYTSDAYSSGRLAYAIEHVEVKGKQPIVNRIERRVGDHATD